MTDTESSTLLIHPLRPFGAKLTNVNLSSPDQHSHIRTLLYENGVLILPADGASMETDPIHTKTNLLLLAGIFGKIENYHPVNKSEDIAGKMQILETMGDTGIPADSFLFHSDMSWRVSPSRASVLCARILPSSGGNTRFQHANLMYQNLSPEIREQLHTISAIHSLKQGYGRVNRPDDVQDDVKSIHPAVIKHPETGLPLLYLNENFTVGLVGMSEQKSTALLKRVFEEAMQSDQILSHTWTPNDIVIWDNLGVQHQALADYQDLRRMHRVVVHEPTMRTERYVGENGDVKESQLNIEHYLVQEDNRAGYNAWSIRYEHDSNQAGYDIPRLATDMLAQYLGDWSQGNPPRILDIAAGTGQNALHLMQNHGLTNIEAMDISTGMLFEARRRELYRHYHEADANQPFPMPSRQYDAALCIGGLAKYQIRSQPALEEAIRVTRVGGLVFLSMREADRDYINEIYRLVGMGGAEVVQKHSFTGIKSNEEIRHCIFVLRVCGDDQPQLAIEYDSSRNPFGVREILSFVHQGDVVLDAGCGTGQHAQHLATVASQVVGIDTDVTRIEIARKNCCHLDNVRFEVGSVTRLPFEDSSFNVVLLAQVLHHLGGEAIQNIDNLRQQCEQTLVEVKRVLRADGKLILVTTSREQRRIAYWHFRFFPESAWQRLDPVWSLTEGRWFTSVMSRLGFVAIGQATPSESHWVDEQDEQMVRFGLNPGWRSTDVAFSLLTPFELNQFTTQVEAILTDNSASDLMYTVRSGQVSHGEATVSAFKC